MGNTTTGSVNLTIDTTPPPAPQIVSAPTNPSGQNVQFDFTVAETGVGTECKLDSGAWATCNPPVSYTGLATGRTRSASAPPMPPAMSARRCPHAWTVDTGIPNIGIASRPPAAPTTTRRTPLAVAPRRSGDLCGTASDPQGNLADVAVSIQRASTSLYWNGAGFTSATRGLPSRNRY